MADVACMVPECQQPVKARGLCNRHYLRELRHGSPEGGGKQRFLDDRERLWSQVDKGAHCWIWTGSTTDGYGYTRWEGTSWRVHRLTYTLLVGPIADDLQLDHLCRNRACCNPAHLEPVTQQENIRRGLKGGTKPTCPNGHPYDTFIERRGGIERRCSICTNANRRRSRRVTNTRFELEDVEFLLDAGETLDAIAARLRVGTTTIETRCRREGHLDLLARLLDTRNRKIAKPGEGITLDRRRRVA